MARKRLNKKIALIGSAGLVLLVLAVIGVILHLSQDPKKFIEDGDVAMKAARQATDEQIKAQKYQEAVQNYHKARSRAKSDSLRIEMLFKLVDVYRETGEWNFVQGCWGKIIQIVPKNTKARFGRLKYSYIMADSYAATGRNMGGLWREIASQASEFIEVTDADLLTEDTGQWDPFAPAQKVAQEQEKPRTQQLGTYLYLLRGRATLEMTDIGLVTDPDESLAQAVEDLEKVRKLEPNNVDAYWYLARAIIAKGQILASRGNIEQGDKAREQAKKLLEQAVDVAGADPKTHINLLKAKYMPDMLAEVTTLEQLQSLEPEYLSLAEKFDTSAEALAAVAEFYAKVGHKTIDKAIEWMEKAIQLDRENVIYAITMANLHYRRFSIYRQNEHLYKAVKTATNALTFPDAQDKPGPRRGANRVNRVSLYAFLANCYIDQVLESADRTQPQTQKWLTGAEQAVHEIEQFFGSGEEPQVVKWTGLLELAKGNRNAAVRKMYTAYEQMKASGVRDAHLSYALANVFKDTSELGAVLDFLITARNAGLEWTKPEMRLDLVDTLLKLRNPDAAVLHIEGFEKNFWPNERSRILRIRACIDAGKFDQAEELLADRPDLNDPNTIRLNLALVQAKIGRLQSKMLQKQIESASRQLPGEQKQAFEDKLNSYNNAVADLVEKLLLVAPNSVGETFIAVVCDNYIKEDKTDKANDLINRFSKTLPDNPTALFYKHLLAEPDPDKISQQRRAEIEKLALSDITDPLRRAINLGLLYRRDNEPNEAIEQFKKILKVKTSPEGIIEIPPFDPDEEIANLQRLALDYLFELTTGIKNWEMTEQIVDAARRENVDDCEGNFFAARFAVVKKEYKNALARLDECLRQRPLFSHGYMLRSNVNNALGNEHVAIEDAKKAGSLNLTDGPIARVLALALYRRNRKLGDDVTVDQRMEVKDALVRAIRWNPRQLWLQGLYAEYISDEEPEKALAILQKLQKASPSTENALAYGKMAMRIALREVKTERRRLLFNIAASAFEQARVINPQNKTVLDAYAEYYRLTDQPEKAEQLLTQAKDKELLWLHYARVGRLQDAKKVLGKSYQTEPKDSGVLKGLLIVAQKTADRQAVKKYSEELLSLDNSPENHLIQIQTFLQTGLVKEAEYKLQSFKEKYPDEPGALLLEAWLVMRQGQLKKALELLSQTLQGDPDNAKTWWLKGEINFLLANYGQAINDLKTSKSLLDNIDVRISLAKAYLRDGREDDAVIELKNVIDNPEAPREARVLLEQVYTRFGRKETLRKFYGQTLKKFPDTPFWYNRAAAFAMDEADYIWAEQLHKQAWEKSSKSRGDQEAMRALDGYFWALASSGKVIKLFQEAAKYVDSDFASLAYLRMAQARIRLGDRTDAIKHCRKAVDEAADDENLMAGILQEMSALLGMKETMKYCKEKLRQNPDSLAANFIMSNLLQTTTEYNKAVHYIDKCLQILGPDDERRVGYTIRKAITLQFAYARTSDNDYLNKAINVYKSLLAEMPNNTSVLNNLAYLLAENNETLTDALEYAERAHNERTNDPGYMDTYAYVLYKNSKYSQAERLLQAAIQQFNARNMNIPPDVYEHLGMVKEKLDTKAEARAAYKQALEAGAGRLSDVVGERVKKAIERLSQQD